MIISLEIWLTLYNIEAKMLLFKNLALLLEPTLDISNKLSEFDCHVFLRSLLMKLSQVMNVH
jgi:hypothetical protein